ncbi:hypothetical protein PMI14_03264, partial [Acidovorax sp. CF316]
MRILVIPNAAHHLRGMKLAQPRPAPPCKGRPAAPGASPSQIAKQ